MRKSGILLGLSMLSIISMVSCVATIPDQALQLSEQSLKYRQIQTRYFDAPENVVLSASAALLQDLGYNIDESATEVGVIVCSKHRDAKEAGQIVGSVLMAMMFGVATPVDDTQLIRVSLITNPIQIDTEDSGDKFKTAVRVTFQRIITNTQGQISRREGIMQEDIYQEFFDKLSQSLFLEAHEI
jgi:hypothetical protein